MPRYKESARHQSFLLPVQLLHQLQPGTFEHAVDHIVDHVLDLSTLDARYANDAGGAPAYNPRALLKVILFAYSRGITSSRQIEEACRENVVFMALAGENKPAYTTIASFLRSMAEAIGPLFRDVLLYCDKLGLIGKSMFAIDGCKISSNASKEWSGTRKDFLRKKEKFEESICFLLRKHQAEDASGEAPEALGGSVPGRREREERAITRLHEKIAKVDAWLKGNPEDKKGAGGQAVKSNITDPDSAKLVSSHGVVQGYNGVAVADEKHQVIVAAEAVGTGSEIALLEPLVDKTEDSLKALGEPQGLVGKVLTADSGYHSEANMALVARRGIEAYVADKQLRKRDPAFMTARRHKEHVYAFKERQAQKKYFTPEDFVPDPATGKLICPAGNALSVQARRFKTPNGFVGVGYRGSLAACTPCALRPQCLRNPQSPFRQVYKFFAREPQQTESFTARMIRKMDSPLGRYLYSQRMRIIEPVFAHIRHVLGFDRFTLRGRSKVNIQWKLMALVHNMAKILRYGWARGAPAPA